uniref:Uncharacterized protein n=1 Tax=Triticum urartu TaxID=4572 RepID=A0A8R7QQY2_TRIUA
MDVSTTKIHLDTFISWTSNSERREYYLGVREIVVIFMFFLLPELLRAHTVITLLVFLAA